MLPQRVERISQALSTGTNDQAMDAVLSLKISSSMIGALAMEQHCVRLERALALTDHTAAAQAGEDVRNHQPKLEKALRPRKTPAGSPARHAA
ncbi:Hpt domain-containing protein [Arthrobacter sp. NA-172]|uniref:Hpt domain-containing protein n=1 Tax=Arthrobacter sp. NA-172 TaxID=3367524 RepID=UPI0037544E7A